MTKKKGYIVPPENAKHEDFSSPEAYNIFFKLRMLSGLLMGIQDELAVGEIHAISYILNDTADEFRRMDVEIMESM